MLIHWFYPLLGRTHGSLLSDRYHGKVWTLELAQAMVRLDHDIPAIDLEQVIPYPHAREMLLNGPPNVAVYECGCRHARKNRCQPAQVCMIVGKPAEAKALLRYFDPRKYLVKITPVNPTSQALKNGLTSQVDPLRPETAQSITEALARAGYEVIVGVGEVEENEIGSNCGQYVLNYLESRIAVRDGYSYRVQSV